MNFSSGSQQNFGKRKSWTGARRCARYSGGVPEREFANPRVGLCADCSFARIIESDRGSTFYLCGRSATDANYPKYPRLPVIHCAGYEQKTCSGAV
jgi:hypothetical protein